MSDEVSIRTPTYRVPRQRGMDPTTRRLAITAGGLAAVLLAVMGAWSLAGSYRSSQHSAVGVPVMEPPPGPMRVKPANPGGMQLSAAEQDLFLGGGDDGQGGKLAPPPEAPDPAALRSAASELKPPPATTQPEPGQAQPPPASHAATSAANLPGAAASAPKPATPAVTAKSAPVTQSGVGRLGPRVQLAALPTEQAARQEWAMLQRKLPELLRGKEPELTSASLNGRLWWRLRVGGFADPDAARAFCQSMHAKGASCEFLKS